MSFVRIEKMKSARSKPFEILTRFLNRYGDEVEGRALDEMPPELKLKLGEFAKGRLSGADRKEVARLLKENPRWVSLLAEEAKAARGSGKH
jgi:hypothetical protein